MISSTRMFLTLPLLFSLSLGHSACQPPEDLVVSASAAQLNVTLRTVGGKFLVAENGGGGIVNANRDAALEWETFALVDANGGALQSGDFVFLRANSGNYFSAENGGGGVINANRTNPLDWESFRIGRVGGGDVIGSGDAITLQTKVKGLFLSAQNGGGSGLTADRATAGGWETFVLGVVGGGNGGGGGGGGGTTPPPGWVQTWSDEFNGPAGGIDRGKWGFDTGGSGFGNNELEYYTDRTSNVALDGTGNLVITARREDYGGRSYTSGRINTGGRFTQAYGRIEARIQIPVGRGIWPAFWMLGANIGDPNVGWPTCGEIDIMENVGNEPNANHGSLHGPGYSGGNPLTGVFNSGSRLSDGFHTYAIEWEPNAIRFYVDNTLYEARSSKDVPAGTRWVYDHPFFIILNVAVGGNWPGSPDGSTQFPQQMKVDYVRVFKRG